MKIGRRRCGNDGESRCTVIRGSESRIFTVGRLGIGGDQSPGLGARLTCRLRFVVKVDLAKVLYALLTAYLLLS